MPRKTKTLAHEKSLAIRRPTHSTGSGRHKLTRQTSPVHLLQQAFNAPETLTPFDILTLQQTAGNRAVQSLFSARLNYTDDPSSVHNRSAVSPSGTTEGLAPHTVNQSKASPLAVSPSMPVIQRQVEEEPLQGKFDSLERKENKTGLPDNLKSGIENLSGYSMDDVKVHYNSPGPSQLQALAYTQGTDIHVKAGEEKHLPHEAWHVVQQKQGRVKAILQAKGLPINDDKQLESEADVMGERAKQFNSLRLQPRKISNTDGGVKREQRPAPSPLYTAIQLLSDDQVSTYMPVNPFETSFKAYHVVSDAKDFTDIKARERRTTRGIAANTIVQIDDSQGKEELKTAIKNLDDVDEKTVKNRTHLWDTQNSYPWKTAKLNGSITSGTSKHQFGMILKEKATKRGTEIVGIKITHYEKPV